MILYQSKNSSINSISPIIAKNIKPKISIIILMQKIMKLIESGIFLTIDFNNFQKT